MGDFGLSKILSPQSCLAHTTVGTPLYFSPELCEGKSYDHKSDIWALGCLLYQLASGNAPFMASNQIMLANKIVNSEPPPLPHRFSSKFIQLVRWMFLKQPESRPSATEILENLDLLSISNMQVRRDIQDSHHLAREETMKAQRTILRLESQLSKISHELSACRRKEVALLQKIESLLEASLEKGNLQRLMAEKDEHIRLLREKNAELTSQLANVSSTKQPEFEDEEISKRVNVELSRIFDQIENTLLEDLEQCGFGTVNPTSLRCLRGRPQMPQERAQTEKAASTIAPQQVVSAFNMDREFDVKAVEKPANMVRQQASPPHSVTPSPPEKRGPTEEDPSIGGTQCQDPLSPWSSHLLLPGRGRQPSPGNPMLKLPRRDDVPAQTTDQELKKGAHAKKHEGPTFITPSPPTNPSETMLTPTGDVVEPPVVVRMKWNDSDSDDEVKVGGAAACPSSVTPSPGFSSVSRGTTFSPSPVAPFIYAEVSMAISEQPNAVPRRAGLPSSSYGFEVYEDSNSSMAGSIGTSSHDNKPITPPMTPCRMPSSLSTSASSPFHQRTTPDSYLPALKASKEGQQATKRNEAHTENAKILTETTTVQKEAPSSG